MATFLAMAQAREQGNSGGERRRRRREDGGGEGGNGSGGGGLKGLVLCLPKDDDGGDGSSCSDDHYDGDDNANAASGPPRIVKVAFGVALIDHTLDSFQQEQQSAFVAATATALQVDPSMVSESKSP